MKKDASEIHATAGLSLIKLSNSAFLICGGTNKEILLFTTLMPVADACYLNDKCIINTTGVTFPIPSGLNVMESVKDGFIRPAVA